MKTSTKIKRKEHVITSETETVYEQAQKSNMNSIINSATVGLHMSKKDRQKDFAHSNHDKSTDGDKVRLHSHEQLKKKIYEEELSKVQAELVIMQYWVKTTGYQIVILFEGRDAAGKGGAVKRLTEPMNPRGCRIVALGTPSDQQKTQWYFQRYVKHLPSAGEIVIFDRSWYNSAGAKKVIGFATEKQI